MASDPVDLIAGLATGADVAKADMRAELKAIVRAFPDADAIKAADLTSRSHVIIGESIFTKDPETVAPDSDISCIRDFAGNPWVVVRRNHLTAAQIGVVDDGGAAAENSARIAQAMEDLNYSNGGILDLSGNVYISETVDNHYNRVLVRGIGPETLHDGGVPIWGTLILPTFAGTAMKHRTPYGIDKPKNFGGGFRGLAVFGNAIATRLLEIDSISGGEYDVFLQDCVGAESLLIKAGISGTDLAEAADVQDITRGFFKIRNLDDAAKDCKGAVLTGAINANVSKNQKLIFRIQHRDAIAIDCVSADSNHIWAFTLCGGTATQSIVMRGVTDDYPVGGTANYFEEVQTNKAIYAEGTGDAGVTAGVTNDISVLDVGNATPIPTAGTGSRWRYTNTVDNTTAGAAFSKLGIGNNMAETAVARERITTESLHIVNSSANHMKLSNADGSVVWGLNINGNELRISPAGAGDWFAPPNLKTSGHIIGHNLSALPAGGQAGFGYSFSATANFGVYGGSGVPTLQAAKGSLYLRSDGSTTNDRAYINTNGATTWTALTTAA